jgi:hypothetical protein
MTVNELIKTLQNLPLNKQVVVMYQDEKESVTTWNVTGAALCDPWNAESPVCLDIE